jgi:hypothetical protein
VATSRLLAIDLEDALLGPDQTIAAEDLAALRAAAQQGVRVTVVTSRLASDVPLPGLECPIVAADGAIVTRGASTVLALHALSPSRAADALSKMVQAGLDVLVLAPDGVHGPEKHAGLATHLVRGGLAPFTPGPTPLRSVLELYGVGPTELIEPVLAELRMPGRTVAESIVIDSRRSAIRVRSVHANRARGLGDLAARLAVRRNDITYVGAVKPGRDLTPFTWSGRCFTTLPEGLAEHGIRGEPLRRRSAPGVVAEALDRMA